MPGGHLSYRRRRLLLKLVAFSIVAGGVAAAVLLLPRGEKPDRSATPMPTGVSQPQLRDRAKQVSAAERERMASSISLFISSAVARHHPERAWPIVHPVLREGMTKRQWSTGNIPVVPYPAAAVDLMRLQSVVGQTALIEVVLEPTPRSHLVLKTFQIELRRLPRPPHQWAVSSWVPEGISQNETNLPQRETPAAAADHARHFSTAWIFIPLGALIGGLILVPIGVFVLEAYRFRRAKAEFGASSHDRGA